MIKKLRIGVVGLRFGQHIVERQILKGPGEPYVELAGICDLNPQRVRAITANHNVPVYPSLESMLQQSDLDVIGLFTPPQGRAELIRQVIRAGKHVLTTKPFEMDPDAAMDVLLEAKRLGRAVHMNSPGPTCPPELSQVLQWHQQYQLGAPVAAQVETWASYREQNDGTWFCDPLKCPAAPVLRIGIYCINDLVRLFGPAKTVQVMHQRIRTGRPTADNAQMLVSFAGGVIGSVFASFCIEDGNPYSGAKRISYERGTIYCNVGAPGDDPKVIDLELVMGQGRQRSVADRATVSVDHRTGAYQWQNLHRAVRGEALEAETQPAEIVAGVAILAAMARASISGATEPVQQIPTAPASPVIPALAGHISA